MESLLKFILKFHKYVVAVSAVKLFDVESPFTIFRSNLVNPDISVEYAKICLSSLPLNVVSRTAFDFLASTLV